MAPAEEPPGAVLQPLLPSAPAAPLNPVGPVGPLGPGVPAMPLQTNEVPLAETYRTPPAAQFAPGGSDEPTTDSPATP